MFTKFRIALLFQLVVSDLLQFFVIYTHNPCYICVHVCVCVCVCVCGMEGSRKPAMGRRSVEGQKKRWGDIFMEIKRWDLLEDWNETAQDRGASRCFVMEALSNVNKCMETHKKERNVVMKKRRKETVLSESLALKCEMTGRGFVGLSKAGLVDRVAVTWKTVQTDGEVSVPRT